MMQRVTHMSLLYMICGFNMHQCLYLGKQGKLLLKSVNVWLCQHAAAESWCGQNASKVCSLLPVVSNPLTGSGMLLAGMPVR